VKKCSLSCDKMAGQGKGDTKPSPREVYRRLYDWFGPQGWWPGDTPFEVMVGAILTQSAAWANVEKALVRLKEAGALERSLFKIADSYEREADRAMKLMTSLVEPAMILIMGSLVGFIVISMLLPIFQIDLLAR